MICRNCLRAASKTRVNPLSIPQPRRFLNTTSSLANAAPTESQTAPQQVPPKPASPQAKPAGKKPTPLVKSSIAAGQPLKGLNFLKNAQDPVARPDDEYPPWLWTLLARQEKTAEGAAAGDLFCETRAPFPLSEQT